jgi:hypothetical protein
MRNIYSYLSNDLNQKLKLTTATAVGATTSTGTRFCGEIIEFVDSLELRFNLIFSPVIIYLFKSFYESSHFKAVYKNLIDIKKQIFILKLDNFEVDEKEFESSNKECCVRFYDLYKHKEDSYNGYEFKRLLNDLQIQSFVSKNYFNYKLIFV